MSQYLEVFLRKKDQFIYLCSFSRSHAVYQIINNHVPYEKIRKVTSENFKEWQLEAEENIADYKRQLAEIEDNLKLVSTFNNSVEEKVEAVGGLICEKNDLLEELERANDALSWIIHLYIIMDSLRYIDKPEDAADIYMGVEVGLSPTVEDIAD